MSPAPSACQQAGKNTKCLASFIMIAIRPLGDLIEKLSLSSQTGNLEISFLVSRRLGMKEDVRRTSGTQVRINIYWLIKVQRRWEQGSLHTCGLGSRSLYLPTAACLWIPTVRVEFSHLSHIYSLCNFSFNMLQGMQARLSGINTTIIIPEISSSVVSSVSPHPTLPLHIFSLFQYFPQ